MGEDVISGSVFEDDLDAPPIPFNNDSIDENLEKNGDDYAYTRFDDILYV